MKIKLIDFGVPESRRPFRPHGNDAGADVYMPMTAPCSREKSQRFHLGSGLKCRTGTLPSYFPAPAWQ